MTALSPEAAVAEFLNARDLGAQFHTILPRGQLKPYGIVHAPFTSPVDPSSSRAKRRIVPELQVDLWQDAVEQTSTGKRERVFDPRMAVRVADALDGAVIDDVAPGTKREYGLCRLLDGPRTVNNPLEADVIHQAIHIELPQYLASARP